MKNTTLSLMVFMLMFGAFGTGHGLTNIRPTPPHQITPCDDLGMGIRCIAS